jgi:hypothetical protein
MIDLKELQKEIDELLDNETDESLLNWYMSKKFASCKAVLGEGTFGNLDVQSISTETKPVSVRAMELGTNTLEPTSQYAMAA